MLVAPFAESLYRYVLLLLQLLLLVHFKSVVLISELNMNQTSIQVRNNMNQVVEDYKDTNYCNKSAIVKLHLKGLCDCETLKGLNYHVKNLMV